MTDREIRAYLRGATRDRVLSGWYHYERLDAREWIVSTPIAGARIYDQAGVEDYCRALASAGIEPLRIAA